MERGFARLATVIGEMGVWDQRVRHVTGGAVSAIPASPLTKFGRGVLGSVFDFSLVLGNGDRESLGE